MADGPFDFVKMAQELQKLSIEAKTSIGTAVELQESIYRSFAEIQNVVGRFAFELADVAKLQEKIGSNMKTNFVLSVDTAQQLLRAGKAFGQSAEQMGALANVFYEGGYALSTIGEQLQEISNTSRKFGVNTQAVLSQVESNLKNANQYGFNTGVDGLARMAAKAASLRSDMTSVFNFAEKVFDPDGAIEAVNTFQRLGVAVGDLADPFRLMYLAQNDVEGLQDAALRATEQFGSFNKETGRFQFSPEGVRAAKELSTTLGMSYDEFFKLSKAQAQFAEVSKEINLLPNITQEEKNLIAGMADFNKDKGGFTVSIGGVEKLVSELTQPDLALLKEAAKPLTLESIAERQLTVAEAQRGLLTSIRDTIGLGVGISPGQAIIGALTDAQSELSDIIRKTLPPSKVSAAGPELANVLTSTLRSAVTSGDFNPTELGDKLRTTLGITSEQTQKLVDEFKNYEKNIENSLRTRSGGDFNTFKSVYDNLFGTVSDLRSDIQSTIPTTTTNPVGTTTNPITGSLTHNVIGNINLNLSNATNSIDANQLLSNTDFIEGVKNILRQSLPSFSF
jgi:hypothetical protein